MQGRTLRFRLPCRRSRTSALLLAVLMLTSGSASWARGNESHWLLVSSRHFSVLTDAGDAKGREVALRLEQMRDAFAQLLLKTRLNLSEPLDVIAVKSDEEYAKLAPAPNGQIVSAPGFFLPGEDRNYIVLNMAAADSWRSVLHDFAAMMLNFNYPPTQPWFDEGFAEYFASLRLDARQGQFGADPGGLVAILKSSPWLSIADLFNAAAPLGQSRNTIFHAESWMLMHYLMDHNKLSETGSYFEAVETQGVPVETAVQHAYGMSSAQLQQAVQSYFNSIAAQLEAGAASSGAIHSFPPPITADQLGASAQQIANPQAQALVAEMEVRVPEHRDAGVADLRSLLGDEKTESVIVHRGLSWAAIQKNDLSAATDELNKALEMDGNDAWSRYYLSAVRYRAANGSGQYFEGMANMMQDLRAVLDWNPDFADAYNMLAMARVEGGGANSAIEAERAAILLSPRNLNYQLNMAKVYMAAKKWEAATALLDNLKTSKDPQVAVAAQKQLNGLPTLRKYGVMPQEEAQPSIGTAPAKSATKTASNSQPAQPAATKESETAEAEAQPDTRKMEFAKGRLVRVDCSHSPMAIVTVTTSNRTIKLRTENYKSLLLIGADQFSCTWNNLPIAVNYKAGGKSDGDLVSLEIQ